MSFENLSAENRNYQIAPLRTRRQQCCSFCRRPGHNLTTCNSDRLLEFEIICANSVVNMNSQNDFTNWLTENYVADQLLVKAFAIRKFRVSTRTHTTHCINLISEYIFRTYKNNQQPEEVDIDDDDVNPMSFEDEMINLLTELRNRREREPPQEIHEVMGIEQIVLREMFLFMINSIRQEFVSQRKLNIISSLEIDETNEMCECNICWEEKEKQNFVKFGCNHEFCKDCTLKTLRLDKREKPCCALCRGEVKSVVSRTNEVHSELADLIA
jgi:hypothetical protein